MFLLSDSRMRRGYIPINAAYPPRLRCNLLYPPTIDALERRGLVDSIANLTPLGLAVRDALKEMNNGTA